MDFSKSLLIAAIFGLSALCILFTQPLVTAQQPKEQAKPPAPQKGQLPKPAVPPTQTPDTSGDSIRIDTQMVQLDVMVVDQANTPVFNLGKDDFTVHEDKVKQVIEAVHREEVPLSFGLVIDTSGSMRTRLQTVTDAALGLIKQMRPQDEGFIAQFKAEPELVQEFTRDKRELEDGLGQLYTSGGTALLDALIATADYAESEGKQRRKALIVISDGVEKNSSVKERQVLEALKEDEVQVYFIGFMEEDEGGLFGNSAGKKGRELLQRLAEDSGGRAFFPKQLSELAAIATQISQDLRTQYTVSYYPTNEQKDGSFRTVQIAISPKDKRKLIARTRRGYYARPEGAAETGKPRKTS